MADSLSDASPISRSSSCYSRSLGWGRGYQRHRPSRRRHATRSLPFWSRRKTVRICDCERYSRRYFRIIYRLLRTLSSKYFKGGGAASVASTGPSPSGRDVLPGAAAPPRRGAGSSARSTPVPPRAQAAIRPGIGRLSRPAAPSARPRLVFFPATGASRPTAAAIGSRVPGAVSGAASPRFRPTSQAAATPARSSGLGADATASAAGDATAPAVAATSVTGAHPVKAASSRRRRI